MHLRIIGLPAIREGFILLEVPKHKPKDMSHMLVPRVILPIIHTHELGDKAGDCKDVLLNGGSLVLLTIDGVPTAQMDGIHGKLILGMDCNIWSVPFQGKIVIPSYGDRTRSSGVGAYKLSQVHWESAWNLSVS